MAPLRLLLLTGAVLLASTLAGCSGGEAGAEGAPEGKQSAVATRGSGPQPPPDSVAKPQWAVGDAWTYQFNGVSSTYVITSETATDWILETDSEERAFADARQDVSRLGPQRKSDLAGSQGEDRVEFFRWPLESGKTWRTRWDQQEVEIRVIGGSKESQDLEARLVGSTPEDPPVYTYTYDAEAGWISTLKRFAPDGGEVVALTLTKAQRNWTGTIVRWGLAEVVQADGSDGAMQSGPFEVPAGTTDIYAEYRFTCTGAAGYFVAILPANPGLGTQEFRDSGPCADVNQAKVAVAGPNPGTWAFTVDVGGQTADFDYAILLRTRMDIKFPA